MSQKSNYFRDAHTSAEIAAAGTQNTKDETAPLEWPNIKHASAIVVIKDSANTKYFAVSIGSWKNRVLRRAFAPINSDHEVVVNTSEKTHARKVENDELIVHEITTTTEVSAASGVIVTMG